MKVKSNEWDEVSVVEFAKYKFSLKKIFRLVDSENESNIKHHSTSSTIYFNVYFKFLFCLFMKIFRLKISPLVPN